MLQLAIYFVQVDALFVVYCCSAIFSKKCQLLQGIILLKWIYLLWFLSAKLTGFCFISPLFRGASKRIFCRKYFPWRDFLRVPAIQRYFFSEVYWLTQCFVKENDRKFSRPGLANRRHKNIRANFHQFHKSFKFQANCEKLSFNFLISNTHGINLFPQIDLFPRCSLS